MASSGVNVLRYTALFTGIAYGLYHQATLTAQTKLHHLDAQYQNQSSLVQKAKAEWAKKNMPASSKTEGGGVISDPEDERFDLEAWLNVKAAEGGK